MIVRRHCCLCFSLRTGAIWTGVLYFVAISIGVYKILDSSDGVKSVVILKCFFLFISGVLLIIGATKEDRVCIITSISFSIAGYVTEILGYIVLTGFVHFFTTDIAAWYALVISIEHYLFIFLLEKGFYLIKEIKEKHEALRDSAGVSANLPNMMISHTLGI